jgi:pentatricopeptide repeat protein
MVEGPAQVVMQAEASPGLSVGSTTPVAHAQAPHAEPQPTNPIVLPQAGHYSEATTGGADSMTQDEADALPFWLRDTAELTAIPELQHIVAEDAQAQAGAPNDTVAPAPAASGAVELAPQEAGTLDDYLDLPPIEPFDFSILQLPEEPKQVIQAEEEDLGFRTGELLASMVSMPDAGASGPTADLDALDQLIGAHPPQAEPVAEVAGALADVRAGTGEGTPGAADSYDVDGQPDAADRPTSFIQASHVRDIDESDRPLSWTAMMTSSLVGEADAPVEVEGTAHPDVSDANPTTLMAGVEEVTVSDLNVDPFDFNKLELEEEEPPTEFLPMSATQPTLVPGTEKLHTSVDMSTTTHSNTPTMQPVVPAHEEDEPADTGALPPLDEAELWSELGSDTELFITSQLPVVGEGGEPERKAPATSWLGESPADIGDAGAYEDGYTGGDQSPAISDVDATEQEGVKVRISQDSWVTRRMLTLQDLEALDIEGIEQDAQTGQVEQAGQAELYGHEHDGEPTTAQAVDAYDKLGWSEPEPSDADAVKVAAKPPPKGTRPLFSQPTPQPTPPADTDVMSSDAVPSDLLLSGPLPVLEGFEELHELVTYNPEDMGAHMALAAAYTQAGELDAALRVYRRMLKKRNKVPAYMLQIIAEELADFEDEFGDKPRFHQVRGDLYMKQGRFREAVEEYNKIK